MAVEKPTQTVVVFGPFEADLRTQELKRQGVRLRLPKQSFQILALLLKRPGQLITREELQQTLWPSDTFVDFEKGINAAINRLREALGDSAESPRYVETLPRRGYRLIAPVMGGVISEERRGEEVPSPSIKTRRILAVALVSSGAILLTVGSVALWKWGFATARAPKVLGFKQLTNDGQVKDGPLATDGSRIYFNEVLPGPRNVVEQVSIHGGEAVAYPVRLKQPTVLDVSEDGMELLFANDEGDSHSLWVQPVAGGSPRRVGMVTAHDARFGPEARSVIYGSHTNIYSVDRGGSSAQKLLDAGKIAFAFRYAPNARFLRFSTFDLQLDDMSIMEATANGEKLQKLFQGCCGRWTSDGRYYVFQNRPEARVDLWAFLERKKFGWRVHNDKPTQLTAGPLSFHDPLPSKDNKQVFAIGISRRAELVRYDQRSGQFVSHLSGMSAAGVAFSRDGRWVAYASFPDLTLWRSKMDGTERQQLTFAPLRVSSPCWSPDGRQIAFSADLPGGTPTVYVISSEGGTPQKVLASKQSQAEPSWSPDGNRVAFGTLFVPKTPIYVVDLRTRSVSMLPGSDSHYAPQWSPDGKFIAAIAVTKGSTGKLMVFNVSTQKWAETVDFPVDCPIWSHDGKYIYFKYLRNQGEKVVQELVGRFRMSDRRIENVVDVKDVGRVTTGRFVDWFGLAPDDSPLFARDISTQEIYALDMEWP
jgi:Tol biopolymer transport system component/DNA-binding winged helix-turn-helix (wHTH) protein